MIANVPGSVPEGVEAVHNELPLGFGANVNRGTALTSAELVLAANPDAVPEPGAVDVLRAFMVEHPRCGVAGPLRLVVRQRRHFHLDEAQPSRPVEADWMLGGFLLLRRAMLDELGGFDEGFRLYGEDIDLQYRAMQAGWERWYVPQAVVRHEHQAETDKRWLTRRTLWHWAGIVRFVRKHPERLKAL